jgi:hypothetical protein
MPKSGRFRAHGSWYRYRALGDALDVYFRMRESYDAYIEAVVQMDDADPSDLRRLLRPNHSLWWTAAGLVESLEWGRGDTSLKRMRRILLLLKHVGKVERRRREGQGKQQYWRAILPRLDTPR